MLFPPLLLLFLPPASPSLFDCTYHEADEDLVTLSYSKGGEISLVVVLMVSIGFIMMIMFYCTRSTKMRREEEGNEREREREGEEGRREGGPRGVLEFPNSWEEGGNGVVRFFLFWLCWWDGVVVIPRLTVIKHVGPDAAVYLQMQIQMIWIFSFLTFLCAGLVPFYDSADPDDLDNQRTAGNIPAGSWELWLVVFATQAMGLVVVGCMFYFRQFWVKVVWEKEEEEEEEGRERGGRVVLVSGFKEEVWEGIAEEEILVRHVERIFPRCQLEKCYVVPDLHKFSLLVDQLEFCKHKYQHYTSLSREGGEGGGRVTLSWLDAFKFKTWGGDALLFLQGKMRKIEGEIEDFLLTPLKKTRAAFLTFRSVSQCDLFLTLTSPQSCCSSSEFLFQRQGEEGDLLGHKWKATEAVHPSLLNWDCLGLNRKEKIFYRGAFLLLLFFVLLFFSTPMAIVGGLDLLLGKLGIDIERWGPQAIVNLLPSLLLVLLAVGVPNLLHLSSGLAKSNTHSKEEMVCTVLIYFFLYLSVFLLPTFMLTSFVALAEHLCASSFDLSALEDSFFPNSTFFVCIVIQAAFVGNGIELFLPGEVIKRWLEWEEPGRGLGEGGTRVVQFYYGFQYAYCLSYFTIALTYSVLVPSMSIAGLTFFVLKHVVDKHNLLYHTTSPPPSPFTSYRYLATLLSLLFFSLTTAVVGVFIFLVIQGGGGEGVEEEGLIGEVMKGVGWGATLGTLIGLGVLYLYLAFFVFPVEGHGKGEGRVVEYRHPYERVYWEWVSRVEEGRRTEKSDH